MSDNNERENAGAPAAWSGQRVRTACLVLIAVCVVGAALYAMGAVLAPLLLAFFLFFLLRPAAEAVARWRVSPWISYPLIGVAFLIALAPLGLLVQYNAAAFEAKVPAYRERLVDLLNKAAGFAGGAAGQNLGGEALSLGDLFDVSAKELIHFAFGTTVNVVEETLMAAFYLFFIFLEVQKLPPRVLKALAPASAERALTIGRTIDVEIRRYLAVKTLVSLGMAAVTGLIGWAFGLDFWFLWAVLTFLANYVTYVGSVVACVPPIVVAFLQPDLHPAAAAALAVLVVANRLFWIDYVEIIFTGKRLNVSPLLLLFGIVAFGWLWGVVGMVLSVPLITAVRIILLSFDQSKPYGVLMSEE
jgi:predicted PurR-regulated permease PerM